MTALLDHGRWWSLLTFIASTVVPLTRPAWQNPRFAHISHIKAKKSLVFLGDAQAC
jgi:hypothetical protein